MVVLMIHCPTPQFRRGISTEEIEPKSETEKIGLAQYILDGSPCFNRPAISCTLRTATSING
jgi:hypothetical protein